MFLTGKAPDKLIDLFTNSIYRQLSAAEVLELITEAYKWGSTDTLEKIKEEKDKI